MEPKTEAAESVASTVVKSARFDTESIEPDPEPEPEETERVYIRASTSSEEILYIKSEERDRPSSHSNPLPEILELRAGERTVPGFNIVRYPGEERFLEDEISTPYPKRSSVSHSGLTISLCKRLKLARRRRTLFQYAVFSVDTVYSTVERIFILDIIHLILSIAAFLYGISKLGSCNVNKLVPVLTVVSGCLGVVANFCNAMRVLCCDDGYDNYRNFIRLTRLSLFIIDVYGISEVRHMDPPEDDQSNCVTLCSKNLYWFSYGYFTYSVIVHSIILTILFISILYYYS